MAFRINKHLEICLNEITALCLEVFGFLGCAVMVIILPNYLWVSTCIKINLQHPAILEKEQKYCWRVLEADLFLDKNTKM